MNTAIVHLKPPQTNLLSSQNPFQIRRFQRRSIRRTTVRYLTICSQHSGPFENFLSSDYLYFLAPVLGLASGFTVYLSQFRTSKTLDIGDWILFTSPSTFNRFVFLRCPSISELLEDAKGRLVEEDRHFVRLDSGRIQVRESDESSELIGDKLVYQRVCVNTKDGGVISLDWPASLDLEEELGLDTTLLLVPGTPEGSMAENVRSFVSEALRRGFFPVVMNPRGCAGSPLTSARLFTAADSDDVSTAIQFINKARPWTSLMSIGWDYGANMLMKYLAEVGERTPLTAAACINNPFDLEEATRCSPYNTILDQKLTGGLVDILKSNKELFQGRKYDFKVESALAAKSVREFEKALSMVSYGFEEIEDFYSKSSTRGVVGNVKIPVLFIQNDDSTAPLFSIPRSSIAENPNTCLLLCSRVPSNSHASGRAVMSWCQNLTIEWLSGVELGLLKGRHPLLKDIDVNFNPSKNFTLVEGRRTCDHVKDDKFVDLTLADDNNYAADPLKEMIDERSRLEQDSQVMKFEEGLQMVENGEIDVKLAEEEVADPTDSEAGHVLQTAEVVMSMLDVTMPGILEGEEKKKVLIAVSQGETLMKALQDAVPEDVRGKLRSAVSGIMHAQNTSVKLNGLLGFSKRPDMQTEIKTQNEENNRGSPNSEGAPNDIHSLDDVKEADDLENGSNNNGNGTDKVVTVKELEDVSSEKSSDLGQSGTSSSQQGDTKGSDTMDSSDGTPEIEIKRESNHQKSIKLSSDESLTASSDVVKEPSTESSTDSQPVEKEVNDNQNKDNKSLQLPDQNKPTSMDSTPPTFDVVQALDALTGMDDSTQVAVNSVFGVIEDMITQFEEENDHKNEIKKLDDIEDEKIECKSDEEPAPSKYLPNLNNDAGTQSARLQESPVEEHRGNDFDPQNTVGNGSAKNEVAEKYILYDQNVTDDPKRNAYRNYEQGTKKQNVTDGVNEADYADRHATGIPLYITESSYSQNKYFHKYLVSKIPNSQQLDLDTTTALLFDYYPEDDQWKLLEKPGIVGDSTYENEAKYGGERDCHIDSPENTNHVESYVEPSFIVLNTEEQQESSGEYGIEENLQEDVEIGNDRLEAMKLVKNIILDALRVEIARKLSADDMKDMKSNLATDLEQVANAVSVAIGHDKNVLCFLVEDFCTDNIPEKVGSLKGEHIVRIISTATLSTNYLRRVLPVGVVIGSSLAALRKYFDVSDNVLAFNNQTESYMKNDLDKSRLKRDDYKLTTRTDQTTSLISTRRREFEEEAEIKMKSNDGIMVGAITAALGASALLVQQQNSCQGEATIEGSSKSFKEKTNSERSVQKVDKTEAVSDKTQNNMVTSLAEKAMSVASPVVPTTEGGELDQERIVAMLAGLGQRGGLLRMVGKVALLWGGIRGAVSLTDKLISFLRLAERPLYQRIIGFFGMVLVLWSPIIVPFLPALVQSWTTNTPSKFPELVIIVGLYAAVTTLVMIWGKRIRGYEDPMEEYGLDLLKLPKIRNLFVSLIGGVLLVLSIQSVNAMLGCVSFSWPSNLPKSSLDGMPNFKALGQVVKLAVQGIITATGVVLVEELVFRAWLPEEIAADLGYHQGIIISGLICSLLQRSLQAVPGLWLLSLALSGFRQRNQGSLSIPIGLHAGIMASSFILQKGGFLTYKHDYPLWLAGTHPFQPFSGIVGLVVALLLAIILYPRQRLQKQKKLHRPIRE